MHFLDIKSLVLTMVVFKMCESIPRTGYSSICNVLHLKYPGHPYLHFNESVMKYINHLLKFSGNQHSSNSTPLYQLRMYVNWIEIIIDFKCHYCVRLLLFVTTSARYAH